MCVCVCMCVCVLFYYKKSQNIYLIYVKGSIKYFDNSYKRLWLLPNKVLLIILKHN